MPYSGGYRAHTPGTASATAHEAASAARQAKSQVEGLEQDVERLLMITEALWSILKEVHGYDDRELFRRVVDIDMRDGRLDGKVAKKEAPNCPHCGRKMIGAKPMCLYCGKHSIRNLFER